MKKALTLLSFIFMVFAATFLNSCKDMPSFKKGCKEERAVNLMNWSDDSLTFLASDTGGYYVKVVVPPHTIQKEWIETGEAYDFIVEKNGDFIHEYPGNIFDEQVKNNTLDQRHFKTEVSKKGTTWVLWRIDTVDRVFSHHDPTIWFDMTGHADYVLVNIDFLYETGSMAGAEGMKALAAKEKPLFFSGDKPFIAYTKGDYHCKVFGPNEKLPAKVGQYAFHYALVPISKNLEQTQDALAAIYSKLAERATTTNEVDYGDGYRHTGECDSK